MATRLFAGICGFFYTFVGLMGFCPRFLWAPEMPRERMEYLHFHAGWLGGYIPVNWPHNILWIIVGVAGLVACASYITSKKYAQSMFALMVLLTFVGFIPFGVSSLWGFLPLFSWNVLIHAFTALLAWYFGFVYTYARELHLA